MRDGWINLTLMNRCIDEDECLTGKKKTWIK